MGVKGSVVRVEPAAKDDPEVLSFLATASGKSNAHHFQQFNMTTFFTQQSQKGLITPQEAPLIADDDGGKHMPNFTGSHDDEVEMAENTREWKGTKWWPGCYTG